MAGLFWLVTQRLYHAISCNEPIRDTVRKVVDLRGFWNGWREWLVKLTPFFNSLSPHPLTPFFFCHPMTLSPNYPVLDKFLQKLTKVIYNFDFFLKTNSWHFYVQNVLKWEFCMVIWQNIDFFSPIEPSFWVFSLKDPLSIAFEDKSSTEWL